MEEKKPAMLALLIFLILSLVSLGGCAGNAVTGGPNTQTPVAQTITPQEASNLIKDNRDNTDFVVLDVRTPQEFEEGFIEGAINLDYYADNFRAELDKLDKSRTYLVYCRSGRRSEGAVNLMKELGFGKIYDMLGGIVSWQADGLPTIK